MNAMIHHLQTQEEIATSALRIAIWKTAPCVRLPDLQIQIWKDARRRGASRARKEQSQEHMKGPVHHHQDNGIQEVQALLHGDHGTVVHGVPGHPAVVLTAEDRAGHPHRPLRVGEPHPEVDSFEKSKQG